MKAALIGLGSMGRPMAENVLKAGHDLWVYNRTKEKAEALTRQGARFAETPAEAARAAGVVMTVLSDDAAVEAVTFGADGLLEGLEKGGIHISVSTISVDCAQKLAAAHAEKGQHFVSATVLGRPAAAAAGALRIIVAGPPEARGQIHPLLEAVGQDIFMMGDEAHLSNVTKIGNNFLLVSMIEALSEAFLMVEQYGIERKAFLQVVNSLFASPVYQNYGTIIAEENFEPAGFKLKLGLKDVELARRAAASAGTPMPLADLASKHYQKGVEQGFADLDWAALIKCLK